MARKRKVAERLRAELKLLMARVCTHLSAGGAGEESAGGSGCRECPARAQMLACVLQARTALAATTATSATSTSTSSSASASADNKTTASGSK